MVLSSLASLRSNVVLVTLFVFLDLTFLLLMIGNFMPSHPAIQKAGGATGIVTAALAYYLGASELMPRGES